MATKHTPGPWRIDPSWDILGNTKDGNGMVCQITVDAVPRDEAAANAHLIAAAPDLLAALKALLQIIEDAREDDDFDANTCNAGGIIFGDIASGAIEASRAAIAKAEGKKAAFLAG